MNYNGITVKVVYAENLDCDGCVFCSNSGACADLDSLAFEIENDLSPCCDKPYTKYIPK